MAGGRPAGHIRSPFARSPHAVVIGTTDANLVIDRVSSDTGPLFGREPAELIGQPIFKIVQQDNLVGLMWALAQATSERKGVSLQARINGAAGGQPLCEMLLAPLVPPPTVAFALVPTERAEGSPSLDVEQLLWQMRRGIEAVCTSCDIANAQLPALSQLSSREIEVVARLFAGQRVPAIAKALFVSQSTVRNHLSSVFRKLNVRSQQELIDLLVFRKDATSSDEQ
jgi:DNA-binding CsgD family transcriptional regulator